MRENGEVIPRCLISTDEKGKTLLPVLNLTGEDLEVRHRDGMGRGEIVIEQTEDIPKRNINTQDISEDEIDTDLDADQKEDLVTLLNDFKDLVARSVDQIRCTDKAEVKIDLEDNKPVVYQPYRLSIIKGAP